MKRPLVTLLAVVSLTFLAAACGGGENSDGPSTDGSTNETATSEPGANPAPEPAAPAPVAAPTATAAPPDPTATPAPSPAIEFAGFGAYDVGVATVEVPNLANERPLTVEVWFPIEPGSGGDPHRYELLPGVYFESPNAFSSEAASIAPGTFPLVLYSHGSGGVRYVHSDFAEVLATHGRIVVAPDHTGNTATDTILGTSDDPNLIAVNRVTDAGAVLDAFTAGDVEAIAPFTDAIDADRIAISGHSFGGFTALGAVSGFDNDLGSVAADPRIDAVVTLAPFTTFLSDERLATVDVPVLFIGATDDETTPTANHVDRPFDLVASDMVVRADLLAAEHETFSDVCEYLDFLPNLEAPPDFLVTALQERDQAGCDPDDMPIERASEITNGLTIAFLASVFDGEAPIDPTAVTLPDDLELKVR